MVTGRICQMIPLFPVPLDLGGAFAYINYSAMVASLANAEAVFVRTIDEGAGVATAESPRNELPVGQVDFRRGQGTED